MINAFVLFRRLKKQVVLTIVSKKVMNKLRKNILEFERLYVGSKKIPHKIARQYARWRLIEQTSDLLENNRLKKIIFNKQNHPELFDTWNL